MTKQTNPLLFNTPSLSIQQATQMLLPYISLLVKPYHHHSHNHLRRSHHQLRPHHHPQRPLNFTILMGKRNKTQSQSQPSQEPSSSSKISFPARKIQKISSKSPQIQSKSLTIKPQIHKPLSLTGEIDLALRHLRHSDPLLGTLINTCSPPTFEFSRPPFQSLAKSILYQQLAFKAATTIHTRFTALCGGDAEVLPATVLALNAQQLREIGVSGRKASYLHDLASKFSDGILSDSSILEMDDENLLKMLTMVKGIGDWSVHMFMIFSLHRPDVLPVGDLGVRKGVQSLYGLKELPKPLEMEELCEKWKPYRTVGAWYMWRHMEAKAI